MPLTRKYSKDKAMAVALFYLIKCAGAFSVQKQSNVNSIHRIVFGTAALSKAEDPLAMLDAAFEKGIRRFDLARTYGMGESERLFGEWMNTRDINREDIDLITKGGIGMDRYGDPDRPLLCEELLVKEVDDSLETLNVQDVDLYMFHRDDLRLGVDKFVEWINGIVQSGKIKRWGVSNWSFERFQAAHSYAIENGFVPPSANSPQFSLAVPVCEVWPSTHSISQPNCVDQIEWYEDHGIELICWEVLAKGFMAKEDLWTQNEVDPKSFDTLVERGSDAWRLQRIQKAYCNDENYRRRDLAVKLAKKSSLKLAQIAMLYPLTKGKHISVIFGSSKTHHIDDMVALQHFNIDDNAMNLFINPGSIENHFFPYSPEYAVANAEHHVHKFQSTSRKLKTGKVPFTKN